MSREEFDAEMKALKAYWEPRLLLLAQGFSPEPLQDITIENNVFLSDAYGILEDDTIE